MLKQKLPQTIGIIGGGQLGMMICQALQKLGLKTVVFTDKKDSPAIYATNSFIVASYEDKEALKEFAEKVDIATFEFENIPFKSVEFIESFKPVYPSSNVLKITQNRILEKSFLNEIGISTADFAEINSFEDLIKNIKKFGKSILKTSIMGYDGKGQFFIENENEVKKNFQEIKFEKSQFILEKFCNFSSEISVIVARSLDGEIACYDPLTNIHKNGILDRSFYPAKISDSLKIEAKNIAIKIANELDLIGVLAVEFFIVEEKLLVNELAPRPHNSGHFSIDGAYFSQFDQLSRAITSMKLGNSRFHSSGFMKNLIGKDVNQIEEFLENENAKIFLYGKKNVADGRKMGHVNILSD